MIRRVAITVALLAAGPALAAGEKAQAVLPSLADRRSDQGHARVSRAPRHESLSRACA